MKCLKKASAILLLAVIVCACFGFSKSAPDKRSAVFSDPSDTALLSPSNRHSAGTKATISADTPVITCKKTDENGETVVIKRAPLETTVTTADPLSAQDESGADTVSYYHTSEYNNELTGLAEMLYNSAAAAIQNAYEGVTEYANTGLVDISSLFDQDKKDSYEWYPEDYPDDTIWDAADAAFSELLEDITADEDATKQLVLNHLLCNMPNELFWFDKTQGMISGHTYELMIHFDKDDNIVRFSLGRIFYVAAFVVGDEYIYTEYPMTYCPYDEEYYGPSFYDWEGDEDGIYDEEGILGIHVHNISPDAITQMREAEAVADGVIAQAEDLSDMEKLTFYHDYICDTITYNTYAAAHEEVYGQAWQMIYVFDNDPETNVVCEGYSKAFKYLCENSRFESDITCLIVTGDLYQSGVLIGGHMWNSVIIDEKPYHIDITNDDNDTDPEYILHDLFFARPKVADLYGQMYYSAGYSCIHYNYDSEMFDVYKTAALYIRPDFEFGDINMDGRVDMADCVQILYTYKNALGDYMDIAIGDMDKDGYLSRNDANVLSDYIKQQTN